MELARIDLNLMTVVADAAPGAAAVQARIPASDWPDLTDRGYPGVGYWPIVDVAPTYNPLTQALGDPVLTLDQAGKRVTRTPAVVDLPSDIAARNQALAALAQILAAGVAMTCTGNSALSGTYAIPFPAEIGGGLSNVGAQANINAVETSLAKGDGLPGKGTTFNFYDTSAQPHAFDAMHWDEFAQGMMNASYDLQGWVLGGFQGTAPSLAFTIA